MIFQSATYIKLFLLALFSVFATAVFSVNGDEPLVTEIEMTKGDSTYRFLYYYNENGDKTLETKWVLINDAWHKKELTEWIYESGICTEQHVRIWKNNDWQPEYLINFEYQNNLLLAETHFDTQSGIHQNLRRTAFSYKQERIEKKEEFSWADNAWLRTSEIQFIYNSDNLLDTMKLREFSDNLLVTESSNIFIYNEQNKVKSILTVIRENDEWINTELTNYYYDLDSDRKSSEIRKIWDKKYGIWINSQNLEYKYDSSNRLETEIYQFWSGAFWKNDLQYKYEYNEDGVLTKKVTFMPIYNDFRPAWSVNYSDFQYSKASLIEAKNEFWGGENGELYSTFISFQFNSETVVAQAGRIAISYIPVVETGINKIFGNKNQIKVYPNPSKGIFYFDSEMYEVNRWIVTDLSGKRIISKEQKERSGVIDLGNFQSGIYLLQVITDDGVKTQKLIKEND